MLTNTKIKSLRPKNMVYRVSDKGGLRGLNIQVLPSGRKNWVIRRSRSGLERIIKIGSWPDMSPAEARVQAGALLERDDLGAGDEHDRPTVATLIDCYLDDLDDLGRTTTGQIRSRLNKHALPYIGDMIAREVTEDHVRSILARIYKAGHRVMANRVRTYLLTAWRWAQKHDNDYRRSTSVKFGITRNPVVDIPRDSAAERVSYRYLSFDEISDIFSAPEAVLNEQIRLAIMVGLSTGGQRPGEFLGMRRSEIDFSARTWSLPGGRTKNRRRHVIPLSDLSMTLINKAIEISVDDDLVFSNYSWTNISSGALYRAVRRYCENRGVKNWSPKDIRTTFKTLGGSIGLSKDIRDRIQNHAMSDVSSKHYDHYDYLDEKRAALDKWAESIEKHI